MTDLTGFLAQINRTAFFQVHVRDTQSDWLPLCDALEGPWIGEQMAIYARDYPGLDRRGQGAFFINRVSYVFASLYAAFDLGLNALPVLQAYDLQIRDDGSCLHVNLLGEPQQKATETSLRDALIELFTPFLLPVKQISQLNQAAQWRLMADSVAAAWLYVGQELQQPAHAMARAEAIIRQRPSPLNNAQTGFYCADIPSNTEMQGQRTARQTFRIRGGCCRAYTADQFDLCDSCVLRPLEEQQHCLNETLRQQVNAVTATGR